MWEYRATWRAKPAWWDRAWQHAHDVLERAGRVAEPRPDVYLVLAGRIDVGLKLRGRSGEGLFDVKVRHQQHNGWELWEKNVIASWNDLERARMAALMRLGPPLGGAGAATPWDGIKRGLEDAGLSGPEVEVAKQRMQAVAGPLLDAVPGYRGSAHWLAELAEFRLPWRRDPVWSICLERLDPPPPADPLPLAGAMVSGYPELLARHVAGTL